MITKQQAREIAHDLGFEPKPLQFVNEALVVPGTNEGFLYIGYVIMASSEPTPVAWAAYLKGNVVSVGFNIGDGVNNFQQSQQFFLIFDNINLNAGFINFAGYKMKI